MSRKLYATALTKEELIKRGITYVDEDTLTIYGCNNKPLCIYQNKGGYLVVSIYELDEYGNKVKIPKQVKYKKLDGTVSYYNSYVYRIGAITLNRVIWA